MKSIVAIRYRDALYFTKKIIKDTNLPIYVAVGRPIVSNDHVVISFTEENGISIRGLLVPNEALILEKEKTLAKVDMPSSPYQTGQDVGIFWKDIVYFENRKVKNQPTQVYTEGQFFSQTSDAVIIKDPETITIKRGDIDNHPNKIKPTFFIVPKVLITGIELYDKKL